MTLATQDEQDRPSKLVGGYTAVIVAFLVATLARSNDFSRAWLVISLLALSLPLLVAWMLLDFIVRKQSRKASAYRGLAGGLGLFPSLLGIAILVGHYSVVAAVLFGLLVAFWSLMIFTVAIVGHRDPESDI